MLAEVVATINGLVNAIAVALPKYATPLEYMLPLKAAPPFTCNAPVERPVLGVAFVKIISPVLKVPYEPVIILAFVSSVAPDPIHSK